jgi:hypothetical protein
MVTERDESRGVQFGMVERRPLEPLEQVGQFHFEIGVHVIVFHVGGLLDFHGFPLN